MEVPLHPLVKVDQKSIGELFVNYLKSQNIVADIQVDAQGFWIRVEEEKFDQARALFQEFAVQPYHPKYQQAAWENGEAVTQLPATAFGSMFNAFLSHAGFFTLTVFSLCWLIYIAAQLGFIHSIYPPLSFFEQLSLSALLHEPWRLIGPAFLHFSLLHIAFNTMWWWQLGGSIEKLFGKSTIIHLFLLSAIISNFGQFLSTGANFGGLSGVVYAVVGFAWWSGWLMPDKGLSLSKSIVGFLLVWLLLGFVDVLPVNMANTAHLLGLVVGCLFAVILAKKHSG
ncbi:rhomboid family intramembrane serine protease GlpG [Thalassotalea sp. M1531]|uniref:Rhomboid family intramembrane serine protease GlpG n=1 Tax=Thalassotalea algicola TaxID=2716224 RepID=A0A7Y0Q9C7_9GAMM|nr:rhomboid family intramembrane serine protease GlpG [Thalassotalea algicola]NMP33080.1 rhomboid family intramembrane serine protease GlpG [Thalassotalea algicola]